MQVETKKAEYICPMDWTANARVYKLDPPYEYTDWSDNSVTQLEFVIVSAVVVMFTGQPETLVFPARQVRIPMSPEIPTMHGTVVKACAVSYEPISMIEIAGRRGTLDHELLLNELGYEV